MSPYRSIGYLESGLLKNVECDTASTYFLYAPAPYVCLSNIIGKTITKIQMIILGNIPSRTSLWLVWA